LSRLFSARAEKIPPAYGPFISPCWPNPGSADRFCGNFRDFFGFFGALKGNLKKNVEIGRRRSKTESQEFRILAPGPAAALAAQVYNRCISDRDRPEMLQ
jgi:hypothetical protein